MRRLTLPLILVLALLLSACAAPIPQPPAAPAEEAPAEEAMLETEETAEEAEAEEAEEAAEAPEGAEQAAELTLTTATSEEYGEYVATSDRPVYMFTPDSADESTCYDDCANAWPPVTVESLENVQVSDDLDRSQLSTLERQDGAMQLVYNGYPLYYFVRDEGADAPQGQEIESFGGEWYLLTPQGTELEAHEEGEEEAEAEAEAEEAEAEEVDTEETEEAEAAMAANEVEVGLVQWDINMPSEIPAGETTFVVTNNGTFPHNFEIENEEIGFERVFDENLEPGETKTMTVDLEPGEYRVYCPIGNHAEQGMELALTVTE